MLAKCVVGCNVDDVVVVATVEFAAPFTRAGFNADETFRSVPWPISGTFSDLVVWHEALQATLAQTCTISIEESLTSVVATIAAAAGQGTATDHTNTAHINADERISVAFDSPATSTAARVNAFTMVFTPDG